MSATILQAQMGLTAISGVGSFVTGSIEASTARSIQAFNNTILKLGAASKKNTITLQEIAGQDASTRQDFAIQQEQIAAEGQARVSAGSAGVAGNSVMSVMHSIKSAAAGAQYARKVRLDNQFVGLNQQRRNVGVGEVLNRDTSIIPNPSVAASVLGMSMRMLELWDEDQTPDEKIASRLTN